MNLFKETKAKILNQSWLNHPLKILKKLPESLRINTILDHQKNLSQDDRDYINVLGMLVYDYEEKNEQFPKLTDGELLQTLMEDYNLEIRDFLGIFEQEQTILDILDGKRQLNSQETFKLR